MDCSTSTKIDCSTSSRKKTVYEAPLPFSRPVGRPVGSGSGVLTRKDRADYSTKPSAAARRRKVQSLNENDARLYRASHADHRAGHRHVIKMKKEHGHFDALSEAEQKQLVKQWKQDKIAERQADGNRYSAHAVRLVLEARQQQEKEEQQQQQQQQQQQSYNLA